jgi:hypothetical protein
LTSCLTGLDLVYFANKNKNCQLSYSWFQTSQTEGQQYSDTSPSCIPCLHVMTCLGVGMLARVENASLLRNKKVYCFAAAILMPTIQFYFYFIDSSGQSYQVFYAPIFKLFSNRLDF